MIRILSILTFLMGLGGSPSLAQQDLLQAVSAAMGEAVVDPRYQDILDHYGLPAPDIEADPLMAAPGRFSYPDRDSGTMLDRVLGSGSVRLGWVRIGIPFSYEDAGGKPQGLAIDLWPLILEKLGAHYGVTVEPAFVTYTAQTGNNDMYRYLATATDPGCAAAPPPGPELCYDIIGGAYALNEPRKKVSAFTPAYYPLNMAAVRSPAPLTDAAGNEVALETAEDVLAAAQSPDVRLVFAVLDATGEQQFLNGLKERFGDTFDVIVRPPDSNVLAFAQNADAHLVLGTNVRLHHTRTGSPQFCADCPIIEEVLRFDGVGFATALPGAD